MRRLALFGLILFLLPAAVGVRQYWATYRDEGAEADYLEIEEPPEMDLSAADVTTQGIPILCYHYLHGRPGPIYLVKVLGAVLFNLPTLQDREYWTLSAGVFDQHLSWLDENGYTAVSFEELRNHREGRGSLPEKPVVITFDDGDVSVLEHGLPILERHDMKATMFVITSQIGSRWHGVETMNWEQMAILRDSGRFEFGSHTHAMHYKVKSARGGMTPVFMHHVPENGELSAEGVTRVRQDLMRSRQLLRDKLGIEPVCLAWPYGFANPRLDDMAAELGFVSSVSLVAGGYQPQRDDPWQKPRVTISARTTLRKFEGMLQALAVQPEPESTTETTLRSGS